MHLFIYQLLVQFVIIFFKKNFIVFTLVLIFFILVSYDKFLLSGYQEYLIFSCLMFISRLFFLCRKNFSGIIIIIFTGHLLIWFKDEGLFYFLLFVGSIVFTSKLNHSKKLLSYLIIFSMFGTIFITKIFDW